MELLGLEDAQFKNYADRVIDYMEKHGRNTYPMKKVNPRRQSFFWSVYQNFLWIFFIYQRSCTTLSSLRIQTRRRNRLLKSSRNTRTTCQQTRTWASTNGVLFTNLSLTLLLRLIVNQKLHFKIIQRKARSFLLIEASIDSTARDRRARLGSINNFNFIFIWFFIEFFSLLVKIKVLKIKQICFLKSCPVNGNKNCSCSFEEFWFFVRKITF